MPRPRKWRTVQAHPTVNLFKPLGVPARELEEVTLTVEGFEAVRLVDLEGIDHETAAEHMGVSRPTFSRVLNAARRIIAEGIVLGKAIRVEGGNFVIGETRETAERGFQMGRGHGCGRGKGGRGRGPGGNR